MTTEHRDLEAGREAPHATPPAEARATMRGRVLTVVRVAVTLAAFGWVFSRVDLSALGAAFGRVPWTSLALAVVLTLGNLGVGSLRWRTLLSAFGASRIPSMASLYRLNVIGFFYNVWLPGGVGGDVVRGIASREAFGEAGATGSVAVVFVERVLGLVGLLLLVGFSSVLYPIAGVDGVLTGSALGIAAGAGALVALTVGRALAPRLPAPLRRIAERLPKIARPAPFVGALALSLVTQTTVAVTGHVFIHALHPEIPLTTSLVMVPLAMATSFIPITAGGAGAREAVFQSLYGHVGVSFEDATAASLMFAGTYYLVGAIGGLLRVPPASASREAP